MDAILKGQSAHDQTDYYHVLGCTTLSTAEQLQCEYKIKALACHPDKNSGQCTEQFKLLQEAKDVLLDPASRKMYDKWLVSGISVPYKQWLNMSKAGPTMHWVNAKSTKPMVKFGDDSEVTGHPLPGDCWDRDSPSEVLKMFRKYEI